MDTNMSDGTNGVNGKTTGPGRFPEAGFLKAMQQIFVDRKMSKPEYAATHQIVYSFCTEGKDLGVWYENKNQKTVVNEMSGSEQLCLLINDFLNKHLSEEVTKSIPETDEDCLLYYCKEWNNFRWSCNVLDGVCRYLNEQRHKRDAESQTVKQMALHIWCEHLFNSLNKKVSKAALEMLERNRNGEIIKASAIEDVIQSYIELGCLEKKQEDSDEIAALKVYKAFEEQVLSGTSEYYSKDGEKAMEKFYVERQSFVEYMKYVQTRLNDELKRANLLHPSSQKPLMQLCCKILIEKHIDAFDTEFRTYLTGNKLDEMELMCSLAIQNEAVIKHLNSIFEEYILKNGLNEMEKCVDEAIKDPKKYIRTILTVHNKYDVVVRQQFKKEVGFKAALEKACTKFINKNAVTGKAKNSNFSAESLAAYCHILLKKSNKSMDDSDIERYLDEIMIIFRFIEDKDVFEGFYKRRLAERLIFELSASDDAEASLISRMKQACGYDYTNKLQSMYADIEVSKNLTDKFRQTEISNALQLDFRIKILTHGCWPLSKDISVNLPEELTKVIDRFTAFYHSQHSGRKLTWLYNLSRCEVIMHGIKHRYTMKANTLQTAVLLQFNEQTTLAVQQLHDYTGIDLKYLMPMLETLIKLKLLKRCDQGDLNEKSNIEINGEYNEPKIRFDITNKLESERRAENKQTLQRIDEDRRHLIEATIVRIMKMRKILSNRILIGEVLSQLTPKFTPKVPHIKKCIEKLIEKEYLERDKAEMDTYRYLA